MIKIRVKYYPMEIRRVRDIFSKHIFSILLGPFLKMLEAFFDLLIPLFMKAIIDLSFGTSRDIVTSSIGQFIQSFGTWVEDNPTLNYSLIGGVCILSMGLIGFLMTILAQYVAAKTSATIGKEVRNALYEKILSLSRLHKFIHQVSTSTSETRMKYPFLSITTGICLLSSSAPSMSATFSLNSFTSSTIGWSGLTLATDNIGVVSLFAERKR